MRRKKYFVVISYSCWNSEENGKSRKFSDFWHFKAYTIQSSRENVFLKVFFNARYSIKYIVDRMQSIKYVNPASLENFLGMLINWDKE